MSSFATSTTIRAPADAIWRTLTDAAGYPGWNATVARVDGRIALGERITVHVKVSPGRAFPVKVVAFDAPRRMVWRGGMPLGLFTGERVFELQASPGGGVAFMMREAYTGWLAPLITRSMPDLQPAFDEFAACLKAHHEGR